VRECAAPFLRAVKTGETIDANKFGRTLALRTLLEFMGVKTTPAELAFAQQHVEELTSGVFRRIFDVRVNRPTSANKRYFQSLDELNAWLDKKIAQADSGYLANLKATTLQNGEKIPQPEIRAEAVSLFFAGDNLASSIVTGLHACATEGTGQLKLDDIARGLGRNVPLFAALRMAKDDIELRGHSFKKGTMFVMVPQVLDGQQAAGDEGDFGVAFSHGRTFCPGFALSRLVYDELQAAFANLRFEPTPETKLNPEKRRIVRRIGGVLELRVKGAA
jgi:cytochrome P450